MGASLWLCAPGGYSGNIMILTTHPYNRYTTVFNGTSASAPTVSGVVALIRSAEPDLTWRDVKLILANSARKNDESNSGWETGALKYGSTSAQYNFNDEYGFGVVDAKAALDTAKDWELLPLFVSEKKTQTLTGNDQEIPVKTPQSEITKTTTITMSDDIEFTEFVQLDITIDAPRIRDLRIELISPSNKTSLIAPECKTNIKCTGTSALSFNSSFRFGSAKHLGEDPAGIWTLKLTDKNSTGTTAAELESWSLTVYGHRNTPDAPAVSQTAPVDTGKITVFWTAPDNTGRSAVSSYDVRYINTNASDKSDTNWTVHNNVASARIRGHTISGLNDNTSYDVQVRARNIQGAGRWSDTVTATPVDVVNAEPYFTEGAVAVRSVTEDAVGGQAVGTPVEAEDTDADDTLSYSLSGTDAAHFTIVPSTGTLQTKSTPTLDYETKDSYNLTVNVSDGKDSNGNTNNTIDDTITVTVNVIDVEEEGTITFPSIQPAVGLGDDSNPDRSRRGYHRHDLALGTIHRQVRMDCHHRCRFGCLHPGHRRHSFIPTGHGILYRRQRIGQDRLRHHGQCRRWRRIPRERCHPQQRHADTLRSLGRMVAQTHRACPNRRMHLYGQHIPHPRTDPTLRVHRLHVQSLFRLFQQRLRLRTRRRDLHNRRNSITTSAPTSAPIAATSQDRATRSRTTRSRTT